MPFLQVHKKSKIFRMKWDNLYYVSVQSVSILLTEEGWLSGNIHFQGGMHYSFFKYPDQHGQTYFEGVNLDKSVKILYMWPVKPLNFIQFILNFQIALNKMKEFIK